MIFPKIDWVIIIHNDKSHFFGAKYNLEEVMLTNNYGFYKCGFNWKMWNIRRCLYTFTILSELWNSYNNLNLYVNHKNTVRTGIQTNINALKKFIGDNNEKDSIKSYIHWKNISQYLFE